MRKPAGTFSSQAAGYRRPLSALHIHVLYSTIHTLDTTGQGENRDTLLVQ